VERLWHEKGVGRKGRRSKGGETPPGEEKDLMAFVRSKKGVKKNERTVDPQRGKKRIGGRNY